MSKPSENIESQRRKFPGVPITSEILKKILSIFNAASDNPKRWGSIRIELRSKDWDDRHVTRHPDNAGILIVRGPRFDDEIDPNKPETFESLELFIEHGFLGGIERESTHGELEKIRAGVRYGVPIIRSSFAC